MSKERDSKGRWPKGVSGNPEGGNKNVDTAIRRRKQIQKGMPKAIELLRRKAMGGNDRLLMFYVGLGFPKTKATMPETRLEPVEQAKTYQDKARIAMEMVTAGKVAADIGTTIAKQYDVMHNTQLLEDLKNRVESLEERGDE